jgi:hypothetical protein
VRVVREWRSTGKRKAGLALGSLRGERVGSGNKKKNRKKKQGGKGYLKE